MDSHHQNGDHVVYKREHPATDTNQKQKLIDQPNDSKEKTPLDEADMDKQRSDKEMEAYGDDGTDALVIREPVDKFKLIYIVLMLHGIGTLMPWNMFITAKAYFTDYKLAGDDEEVATYRKYFLSALGFVAQVPNVGLNALNVFCQCKGGNPSFRIVWSINIVLVMFIFTILFVMVDSSAWQAEFFWITMVSVVIINMANGVYQNSVYGTAAILPMKYTNAVVLGSNMSGTLTSVLNIAAIAIAPDPRTAAMYYFLTAIVVLLVASDTYFSLPFNRFFRYHETKARLSNHAASSGTNEMPPYLHIIRSCWVQYLSVFFVFFVTLTCFPAITANIQMSDPEFFMTEKYYTPVTCFLFFNFFAMLGNLATEFLRWPGPRWVWLPVLLRVLFIPFFMLCNFNPQFRTIPVLIHNDYVYIIGVILMAFTSGYYSSLTMMYAPGCVNSHQGTAGMMAAFFLILGITIGVVFSMPVTRFVELVGNWECSYCVSDNSTALTNGTLLNMTAPEFALVSPL